MRNFFDLVYREKCKKVEPVNVDKVGEMICNDIQVWHINNTMIFTPFKDKRLLSLLECDSDIIIDQVTDGKLSKMVIEFFNKDANQSELFRLRKQVLDHADECECDNCQEISLLEKLGLG